MESVKAQENDFSVRHHLVDLLYGLCSYKVNKNDERPLYLGKFLEFCLSNLNQYQAQLNEEGADWRIKESVMNVIASLVDLIRIYPEMRDSMEQMMKFHILPELKSPEPYL